MPIRFADADDVEEEVDIAGAAQIARLSCVCVIILSIPAEPFMFMHVRMCWCRYDLLPGL
jgi:hypothetical protein